MNVRLTSAGTAADCENFYDKNWLVWSGECWKCI